MEVVASCRLHQPELLAPSGDEQIDAVDIPLYAGAVKASASGLVFEGQKLFITNTYQVFDNLAVSLRTCAMTACP